MASTMSGFVNAKLLGGDYLFLLLDFLDYVSDRSEAIKDNLDAFGQQLGPKGWVVSVFERATEQALKDLKAKPWPDDVKRAFEDNPDAALLVITKDFAEFDPQEDPWAVIWFGDHEPSTIYRLFNEVAKKVKHEEDLFGYLEQVGRRRGFRRLSRYVGFQPKIFGISINANAIFDDLVGQPV